MYAVHHMINGVQAQYRRSQFFPDTISTRRKYNPEYVASYRGVVTETIQKPEDKQTIYHIDDIVEVTTVSDQIREEKIKHLEQGQNVSNGVAWLSGGAIVAGAGLLYMDLCTAGMATLGMGVMGTIAGITRSREFSKELSQWKNRLPQYIATRRAIPLKRYTYIHSNKLINQFLLHEEAYKIWKEDIKLSKNSMREVTHGSHRTKVDAINKVAEATPLDTKYIADFEIESEMDRTFDLGKQVRSLMNQHQKLTTEYKVHKDLIEKARDGDIAKSNSGYDATQSIIGTVQTVDAIVDSQPAEEQRPRSSSSSPNNNHATNRVAKSFGFFGASMTVEGLRASREAVIRSEYESKLSELKLDYEINVTALLPPLLELYEKYDKPISKL